MYMNQDWMLMMSNDQLVIFTILIRISAKPSPPAELCRWNKELHLDATG